MDILIFDMDGVLVRPRGYHRALQETVRLAGITTGFGEVLLTDEQITQFEALGISSEWHSSALCLAVMVLANQAGAPGKRKNPQSGGLNLADLFAALAIQPLQNSALLRGAAAIEILAAEYELPAHPVRDLVVKSESIESSPTLNWFQELILGSENYNKIYQKAAQFQTESYLNLYDQPQLDEIRAEKVITWADSSSHGAAIMTNRPSRGPSDFSGMPDAELGSRLVGLAALPVVGKGEILWLAAHTGQRVENISKPAWKHAMAAILVASGWQGERSLKFMVEKPGEWDSSLLKHLRGGTVTVFEDTPSGLVAAQEASELLKGLGLQIEVQKIGIAKEAAKHSALSSLGATVYADINQALESLDDF